MRQQSFSNTKSEVRFGGSLLRGKRKSRRPLCSKRAQHLVLKANDLQKRFPGVSFVRARAMVTKILKYQAEKHHVQVHALSVNWNHCHLAIKFQRREDYIRFIRAVTGHLTVSLSHFFKKPLKGLFDLRPYTRVVEWGRSYKNLLRYIQINIFESEGVDITGRLSEKQWKRSG